MRDAAATCFGFQMEPICVDPTGVPCYAGGELQTNRTGVSMGEVNCRTDLMDGAGLRDALGQIERGLNELRDMMVEDRDRYPGLLEFADDIGRMAAHARQVLARTGPSGT